MTIEDYKIMWDIHWSIISINFDIFRKNVLLYNYLKKKKKKRIDKNYVILGTRSQ